MDFKITTELCRQPNVGEIAILNLIGAIDRNGLKILEEVIQKLYKKNIYRLIFDMAQTTIINSSAIGFLINTTQHVEVCGGGIRLIRVAERFKILFQLLCLENRLPILETRNEAIASFGKK
jgi:anti-sigma B factor antagonist